MIAFATDEFEHVMMDESLMWRRCVCLSMFSGYADVEVWVC